MALIDNLVAYWKLDETSGTNADDAHGANDGTLVNMEDGDWQGAGLKLGLDFDGTNEYVSTNASASNLNINGAKSRTVAFWAKVTTNDAGIIFDIGNGGSNQYFGFLKLGSTNAWRFGIWGYGSGDIDVTISSSVGSWHHWVCTYNGTYIELFYDGASQGTSNAALNTADTTNFEMGVATYGSDYYDGLIDEMGVWDRVLTSTEITELYNSGNGFAYPFTAVGTNISINIADTFKDVDSIQTNIGDVWKDVIEVQQNIGDVWKTVF